MSDPDVEQALSTLDHLMVEYFRPTTHEYRKQEIEGMLDSISSGTSWKSCLLFSQKCDNRKRTLDHEVKSDDECNGKNNKRHKTTSKDIKKHELETDPLVLQRRQKQIDYGKNTVGYHNYTQQVPKDQRNKDHPRTPDKYCKYSRRSFDQLIKIWRRQLHQYDPDSKSKNNVYTYSDDDSD